MTAYIQLLFTGRTRGKAFAIMGAVIGVSSALGPLIGGLLIQAFGDTNGWRLVFVVNLPIGIVALIAAVFLLPAGSESPGRSGGVDFLGLLLLSGGLVAILVPLIEGQDQGWPVWTYLSLIGGVALIALFGAWEVAVAKRGKSPLVPPHLFSHPAFTGGVILALVYFAAFVSIFFTISILWQAGLGHTALESRSRLHPVRARQHRRRLAERQARGQDRPHGARHRRGDGRGRPHRALARAPARVAG